ncbi:MAG: FprA family A-type flavoprotein [Sarcina ventriculi]|uniref:FprA family A-type flavoprotein n=1 Tax=Candidatus Sarcina troglodytae TaxID=2726954 RepID=A0ACD1BFY8_9CLOT|nr:FprA family A-type flavoprotein [Sarcina sp. JB2]MDO4401548.1 FprA family A-type flavoprotein [Clostridiaceae bacterium]MDY7061642.1 FprA family A-type flavoprotein [Sarcina ventriculi]QPJ86376.1 FprA family A-type flavoprotein [Sarcina sp. JB2]
MNGENIYSVGVIDDRKVPFHRLILEDGTTYNSYLLKTEKPTIIDAVDFIYSKQYLENLKKLIDLKEIQYIVINHTEPDHSGALGSLAKQASNATIVCSEKAVYHLKELYRLQDRNFLVVKDRDTLDIGGKTLLFRITPFLHTEETMITYCIEDKTLFPCDIFSTHLTAKEYFVSKAEKDITEAFTVYYDLIMSPHRKYVRPMMSMIKELDIDMIAPSHGYILDEDIDKYISIYDEKSKQTQKGKKATIVYTTMRNSTKKIAEKFKELFEAEEVEVAIFNADKTDENEILDSIKASDAVLFGTSTKYGDLIGSIENVLKKLKDMNLEGKVLGAFGSFGWSGEPIEIIQDYLNETNGNVLNTSSIIKSTGMIDVNFPVRVRFSLNEESEQDVTRAADYIISIL